MLRLGDAGSSTVRSGSTLSVTVTPTSFSMHVQRGRGIIAFRHGVCWPAPKLTVTAGYVVVRYGHRGLVVLPPLTRVGNVPKPSFTDSPSSSTLSLVALKVNVFFGLAALLKGHAAGTPE